MKNRVACAALLSIGLGLPFPGLAADWRADFKTFRIGMVAGRAGPADVERVRRAYAAALGVSVEIVAVRNEAALIDADANGRVDYAIHSALGYAVAARLCVCVEPIAAPVSVDGATGVSGVLIVRATKVPSLDALAGAVILAGPDDVLTALFQPKSGAAAPTIRRAATMEEAEALFLAGEADALFGWRPAGAASDAPPSAGTMARLASAGADPAGLSELWTSVPLRFGPHAVSKKVPAEARTVLTTFLSGLAESDPETYAVVARTGAGGFRPATEADYAGAFAVAERLAGATDWP